MGHNGIILSDKVCITSLLSAFYYDFHEKHSRQGGSHSGWEFVYVESGNISVLAENKTYILKAGEMVCHKPHEYHLHKAYHGKASVLIICFECDEGMDFFNNKILKITPRQKQYLNDVVANAEVLLLPKEPKDMIQDGKMERSENGTVIHEQYIKNAIELLILSLLNSQSDEQSKRIEFYRQHLERKALTKSITEYLNENICNEVQLSDISSKFSYSLSSIKRIFKRETGFGIIEYLTNLRIERAKELLKDGYSVKETATLSGFPNVYYFSNTFKNKTGISPSKYKKEP